MKLILALALALPALTAVMPTPANAVCVAMCDYGKRHHVTTTCRTVKTDQGYVTQCSTYSRR